MNSVGSTLSDTVSGAGSVLTGALNGVGNTLHALPAAVQSELQNVEHAGLVGNLLSGLLGGGGGGHHPHHRPTVVGQVKVHATFAEDPKEQQPQAGLHL